MKQLEPDLWQTSRRSIAERVHTHAYLLIRPTGNLLIYGIGDDQDDDLDQIERLGGVSVQVLSHRDESGPSLEVIRERFGSRLACGVREVDAIRGDAEPDLTVGSDCDDPALQGVEILETPGHTPGSISFRYRSPNGRTYLFTGDTIFPNQDRWGTAVYPQLESDSRALINSLKLLRDLSADLVISSAYVGDTGVVEMTPNEWAAIIDQRIDRLRAMLPTS